MKPKAYKGDITPVVTAAIVGWAIAGASGVISPSQTQAGAIGSMVAGQVALIARKTRKP